MATRVGDRSTPEVVLLVLTGLITVLLILAALGVLLIVLIRPDVNVDGVVSSLFDTLKVIIGAVVGYAAGYATVVSARDVDKPTTEGNPHV